MKKFLSILLVSAMMLSLVPMADLNLFFTRAYAAEQITSGTYGSDIVWEYNASQKTLSVSGNGIGGWSSSEGAPWLSIAENVEQIIIKDGVKEIADYAFEECINVREILVSASVSDIEAGSFSYSEKLEKVIVDENNLNYHSDENGILFNKDLTEIIMYPSSKTETEYTIPDSVVSIAGTAFYACHSLEKIVIHKNVSQIEKYAFDNCDNLKSYVVNSENSKYLSDNNGVLYTKDNSTLLDYPTGKQETEYNIPDLVTIIEAGAFSYNENIKKINIPEGVTKIGDSAFSRCVNLESIVIPESAVDLGGNLCNECLNLKTATIKSDTDLLYRAFYGCENLSEISLENINSIGASVFEGCSSLIDIQLPNGVETIGNHAFRDCTMIESINIPNGVTGIGRFAFCDCVSLTDIELPESATDLDPYIFHGCKNLTKVKLPSNITSIKEQMFYECESLKEIEIPAGVTVIEDAAFTRCGLENIKLPSGLTSIEKSTFSGTKLKSIEIPAGVTEIGDWAFSGTDLELLEIPNGVTSIGEYAFAWCENLKEISIPASVETIDSFAFSDLSSLMKFNVSSDNKYFMNDEYGTLFDKNKTYLMYYPLGKHDSVYVIPQGVQKLGCEIFWETVPSIGNEHIYDSVCDIVQIHIPKSLETIIYEYEIVGYDQVSTVCYEGTLEEYNNIPYINELFPNATVHPNSYNKIVDDEPSEDDVPEMPTVENPIVLDWEEGCFGETEVTEVYECIENNFEKGGVYISENDKLYNQFALYRIKILGENGEIVQPQDGYEVTVRILLPQEYKDIKNFYVVHWFNEGGREKIYDVKNENGCLVFKTKSFSEFAICADLDFGFEDDSAKLNYKSEKKFSATTDSKTKVVYSSSDESVAAVDSNGNVKAVGIGSATITATIDGTEISDSINITVSYAWWQWIIRILLLGFLWY